MVYKIGKSEVVPFITKNGGLIWNMDMYGESDILDDQDAFNTLIELIIDEGNPLITLLPLEVNMAKLICKHCGKEVYYDMEGDLVHKNPEQKNGDGRFCGDTIAELENDKEKR